MLRFIGPRYWPTWLLLLWLRLAVVLPMRWTIALHKAIGRAAGALLAPRARTARRNLELCFPELDADGIDDLLRRHYEALGACLAETALAWFASPEQLRSMLDVEGIEHLQRALAQGKGVLLYTGHFTPLELSGPLLAAVTPQLAFMFSPRNNALLDEIQARGRARITKVGFASSNVRALLRNLRRNAVIWYAADQYFRGRNAQPVRFFHEAAMTNTAISRLARVSGAVVLPFSYRRSGDDSRYVLRFEAPLPGFPSHDEAADTRRLVERLEAAIRLAPEQYLWGHKRYRGRPPPLPDLYAQPPRLRPDAARSRRPGSRVWAGIPAAWGRLRTQIGDGTSVGSLRDRVIRGLCIGASELVPGFSGGTTAFMLGVHQRLLRAVSRLDIELLRLLWQRRFIEASRRLDLLFVAPIAIGAICALFLFSRAIPLPLLVTELPEMTYGFLFGLVSAALVSMLVGMNARRVVLYGWLIAGVVIGASVAMFAPATTSSSAWWLFLCGGFAVIATLMPGMSGAFVLIVLGKYVETMDAFQRFDLGYLLPLAAGVLAGAVLFSRLATWLLEHHRQSSMLAMVGLLGGSLLTMWPFQEWAYIEAGSRVHRVAGSPYVPQTVDPGVVLGLVMMVVGAAAFRMLQRWMLRAVRD